MPILQELLPKLQSLVVQLPDTFFQPLTNQLGHLDGGQRDVLHEVDQALRTEYSVRRRMLIERVKVWLCLDLVRLLPTTTTRHCCGMCHAHT